MIERKDSTPMEIECTMLHLALDFVGHLSDLDRQAATKKYLNYIDLHLGIKDKRD